MKKEWPILALLLQTPVAYTAQALAPADMATVRLDSHSTEQELELNSVAKFQFKGQEYRLKAYLLVGQFTDRWGDENMIYELQGHIYLSSEGHGTYTLGQMDDGEMMFELVQQDENQAVYRGYSCSSTFTSCEIQDRIELIYQKAEKAWALSADTTVDGERLVLEGHALK